MTLEIITTILGAALGGLIGYFFSRLQWQQSLAHEDHAYRLDCKRRLVELSYETIEFIRDYYCNSKSMEIGDFMNCMSGRNPIKSMLAIVVVSAPELSDDVAALKDKISTMMGPEFPVPEEKYLFAVEAANEFGRKALVYVKTSS